MHLSRLDRQDLTSIVLSSPARVWATLSTVLDTAFTVMKGMMLGVCVEDEQSEGIPITKVAFVLQKKKV